MSSRRSPLIVHSSVQEGFKLWSRTEPEAMPAHSTCEDALASAAAFSALAQERARKDKRLKAKAFVKKEKKKKSHKHKTHKSKSRTEPSDSDSVSDSARADTLEEQLMSSRQAVCTTRDLLTHHSELRSELRELIRRLDAGEALDLTGIPDLALQQRLKTLFRQLRLHCTKKGIYVKRKGAPSALDLLGGVIAEAPAVLASQPDSQQPGSASGGAASSSGVPAPTVQAAELTHEHVLTDTLPAAGIFPSGGLPLSNGSFAEPRSADAEQAKSGSAAGIAPASEPAHQGPDAQQGALNQDSSASFGTIDADISSSLVQPSSASAEPQNRRVAGPAMPPAELLEAAAAAAEQMLAEGEMDDLLIGPIPPDVGAEADAASGDVRIAEVTRILRVVESLHQEDARPSDAYAVLGVEAAATAAEIKKRFWRLSLLTHPDKCQHPRAHAAFDAVAQAAKSLQDTQQRAAIDKKRQDAQDMRDAVAAAVDEERTRQWRIVQGKATAEDLAGPRAGPEPLQRGAWMTALPDERRPNAVPSQKSQTAFASQGVQRRGDTSSWTDTPQQKLQRLQRNYEEQTNALPATGPASAELSQAVGTFNLAQRGQTLLEQHQDRLKKQHKEARKERKRKAQEAGRAPHDVKHEAWTDAHPWQPFDREKLTAGRQVMTGSDLMRKSGALSDRFAR